MKWTRIGGMVALAVALCLVAGTRGRRRSRAEATA